MLRVLDLTADPPAFRTPRPEELTPPAEGGPEMLWIDVQAPTAAEGSMLTDAFGLQRRRPWDPDQPRRQRLDQLPGQMLLTLLVPTRGGEARDGILHLVAGERWMITSHDGQGEIIARVAEELGDREDLATLGAVAAVATLLEHVVDGYGEVVGHLEPEINVLEEQALDPRGQDPVPMLHTAVHLRRNVSRLRRGASDLREVMAPLLRRELADTRHGPGLDLELRDVADHLQRALDDLALLHERMTDLAETRLAMVAYRQNDITKRLSAWGAILLVPTVITGWFGQNFAHMALIDWRFGALVTLLGIAGVCAGLFALFRRAGWL